MLSPPSRKRIRHTKRLPRSMNGHHFHALRDHGTHQLGHRTILPSRNDLRVATQQRLHALVSDGGGRSDVEWDVPAQRPLRPAPAPELRVLHRTRDKAGHADAVRFHLLRQRQRQRLAERLRGAVQSAPRRCRHQPAHGGHHQDATAPLLLHVAAVQLRELGVRQRVHHDHPVGVVGGHVHSVALIADPGVVDQDVHHQSRRGGRRVDPFGGIGLRQIGLEDAAADAVACLQVVRQRRQSVDVPGDQNERHLPPRQLDCDGATDALRCTRHERVVGCRRHGLHGVAASRGSSIGAIAVLPSVAVFVVCLVVAAMLGNELPLFSLLPRRSPFQCLQRNQLIEY
mmetsp:Transcript_17433/g.49214  ORF Transcript_17433/g.49214 Transcript_17433/m.49214 type:complete len:342 (+) Transcript_17433:2304-3329(+)